MSLAAQQSLESHYVMHTFGRSPVEFVEGHGMKLTGDDDREYLDFLAGIGVFIVDMFIPYATLVNIIMTYCGYTGGIVFLVLTVRWLMVRNQDKKKMVSE